MLAPDDDIITLFDRFSDELAHAIEPKLEGFYNIDVIVTLCCAIGQTLAKDAPNKEEFEEFLPVISRLIAISARCYFEDRKHA